MIKIDLPLDFPKELLTPIKLKKPPIRGYWLLSATKQEADNKISEELSKYGSQIAAEKDKKFRLLMDYYKVGSEVSPEVFVYKFIEDVLPGFKVQEPKKVGRTDKWDSFSCLLLWHDVNDIVLRKGHTASAACNILVKTPHWKTWLANAATAKAGLTQTGKNLHNRYVQACKLPLLLDLLRQDTDMESVLKRAMNLIGFAQKVGLSGDLPAHPLLQKTFPETESENL
jgi:hypothetical protein